MNSTVIKKPDISVVIPAYNSGRLLRLTLDSILAQTGVSLEVIVINDGSTDETPEVLNEYANRITSFNIPNSGGPSIPRNEGVSKASADLIAIFDSDDLMHPGKLEKAVEAMRAHPQVGLLCTEFEGINSDGIVFRDHWLAEYKDFRKDLIPQSGNLALGLLSAESCFHHLLRANFIGTSSVVCRRAVLNEVGPFNVEMKNSDDRDMWYRIARSGWDLLFLDEVCHSYRKTGEGVSARGGKRNKAIISSLSEQLNHISDPQDRIFVLKRLRNLWLGYGYWLRSTNQNELARVAYKQALALGPDFRGIAGWIRSLLGF